MADQNPQTTGVTQGAADAPLPEWLKKTQTLQMHEERGAAVPAIQSAAAAGLPGTSAPSVTAQIQVVTPVQTPVEAVAPGSGAAPLPEWLKKASEKPLVPSISEAKVPDDLGKMIADSQPDTALQPVSAPAATFPVPAATMVSTTVPGPQSGAQIASTSSLQSAVPAPAAVSIASEPIPGLLETSAAPVSVSNTAAPALAINENTLKQSTPVVQTHGQIAQAAEQKSKLFDTLKSSLNSVFSKSKVVAEKGAQAVEKAKAAGAPSAPPKLPPAQAAVKAAQDKATAEERRQMIEAEKIFQQGLATIRDLIAPSSMEIKYDLIRIEGMYAQTFFVYAYPRYLDTNWLSPVVNFDVTMDIAQFIYPIDSAAIMTILKKKVAQMQASIRMATEKGMVRDPALETSLEDAEGLRTQIQRGQEKFFQFALYFTIYSEDEKKLIKISKQLESILGGKLILTKKSELQMENGFNSCLPLCLDELEINRNMNTSPLSTTFPFSSADLTSNEGILYGLNRHNDSLIIFDRFSLENANSVVFAKSGAGKSYCVKLEILRSLMLGSDVIVIDPENEYEALSQTVGGSYLKVSLTSDRRINPFDLPASLHDEELQPGDLLRSNIINLHGLLKIMLGGVTPSEEGILDKALNDVYAVKGITMDMLDPSKVPPPTMEDLYDILSNMDGGQSLAQRLQKYTQGTYSGIFNKPTNVDLSSGLMVFSIRDLEDALRPTAMYIILNYIWNRVRSQLKKRLLIIDEAWTMMQYEDSAKFLFGLVKRARKYYLGITTITQDVEDFVKSPFGKPVITNSSMQMLLKQAPSAVDILGKVFNLTEGEKYMLLNSGVGQGLFFAGLKHVAIQIIASYTEDKIVTTNPEEILRGRIATVPVVPQI